MCVCVCVCEREREREREREKRCEQKEIVIVSLIQRRELKSIEN